MESYERTLKLDDSHAEAHSNRGVLLQDVGDLSGALSSLERAIDRKSDFAHAYSNRGNVLKEMNRLAEALLSYEQALQLDPDMAEAHTNRGNVLKDLNRLDESLASHDEALKLNPDLADARFNRSVVLLTQGDYERGFAEYEWRWRVAHGVGDRDRRRRIEPLWLGAEPLAGKSILLHGEQGLGDTIQFCRYVPLVAQRGARVILQVPPPLQRLMADLPGVAQCVADDDEAPACDFHCPLLSLPLAFGTTLQTVPAQMPYLRADAATVAAWRERIGPRTVPLVGLVWSGGVRPDNRQARAPNQRRNMPLAALAPILQEDFEFVSLQKGEPAEAELDAGRAQGFARVREFAAYLTDFNQTAGLIEQLDLVISVDTSTAHLAGALGKPVWILNRFDSCWRWLTERNDSPWYPNARLYRQPSPGDWPAVVRQVGADLVRFTP